jgi:dethiobiotin synthetase
LCVKDIHTTLSHNINTITANHILIEGIGGIMVPLNADETYLDVLGAIPYPLILVVGMKLGCLNHALLSATALQARGIKLSGWIANQIDPNMSNYHENCNYLQQQLGAPLIATTPFQQGLQPTNFFEELFPCL